MSSKTAILRSKLLEASGILTFNASQTIEICSDKARQALMFEKNGIPQPKFGVAFSTDHIKQIGGYLGGDYLIKPIDGSWGRGITRIQNDDYFETWFSGRESVDPAEKAFPLLIQKYVPKDNFDIRVIIVGKEPIAAIKRISTHWKTNTHLGAEIAAIPVDREIRNISEKVVQILSPGIYGLDLIEHKKTGQLLVCEVNHNPDFARSSKVHGVDVAQKIASYIQKVLMSHSSESSSFYNLQKN